MIFACTKDEHLLHIIDLISFNMAKRRLVFFFLTTVPINYIAFIHKLDMRSTCRKFTLVSRIKIHFDLQYVYIRRSLFAPRRDYY